MRVAVTSEGTDLHARLDPRFGRAKYFVVVDTETGAWTAVDNSSNRNALQGAGVQAGKSVVDLGVDALISGHVGPKGLTALRAGGVKVYAGASGTVADAVELFKQGKLSLVDSPDVQGHWI